MKCWLVAALAAVGLASALATAREPSLKSDAAILKRFVAEFVPITPGMSDFPSGSLMGSSKGPTNEQPAHKVTFNYAFAIARFEVTQELYETIMGKNPSRWKGPRNSVEMVNWHEASDFCRKTTAELHKLKLVSEDEVIRLPSEAEWEYCCRAGTTTVYCFGDSAETLKEFAWFKGNSKGEDPPVGRKKPNAWGLYDMHGYVWEWCLDAWHDDYTGAPADGSAWSDPSAKDRVARGGSWADDADAARSAYRQRFAADHRSDTVGFRCVRVKKGDKGAP